MLVLVAIEVEVEVQIEDPCCLVMRVCLDLTY